MKVLRISDDLSLPLKAVTETIAILDGKGSWTVKTDDGKLPPESCARAEETRVFPCKGALGFWKVPTDIAGALDGILRGECACTGDLEDPGPEHLPTCPYSDPEHDNVVF